MLAMTDCGYSPVHGFTVVVALQCWSINESNKQTTFHNRRSYLGPDGAKGVKMVWTFSVHTAIDIKKGSVINVVCYERGCYERVCYEHVLLWKWYVLNGSVVNVVCYERVYFEWEPFWSSVMFLWVTSFKLFTVIGFSAKWPSYWRWWWQLHILQQFWPQK